MLVRLIGSVQPADRQLHNTLTASLVACLEENGGSEVLLLALQTLRTAAEDFCPISVVSGQQQLARDNMLALAGSL